MDVALHWPQHQLERGAFGAMLIYIAYGDSGVKTSASCIRDSSRRVLLAPGSRCHVLGHKSANI